MHETSWAWFAAAATCTLVGCGSGFTSSSPGDGGKTDAAEAAAPDGAAEAGQPDAPAPDTGMLAKGTYCGPMLRCTGTGGQQGTVCCVSPPPSAFGCASLECGCGGTQLDCASPRDCLDGQACCILNSTEGCSSEHPVARCQAKCPDGARLCDPAAPETCTGLQKCSTDTKLVGLPSSSGFGLCR